MTAKEYLKKIRRLDILIRIHIDELKELRFMADGLRSPGFDERYGSSMTGDAPFIRGLEAVSEMEDQVSREIARLTAMKRETRERIAMMAEEEEKTLLKLRYLSKLSWKEIESEMHLSEASVHRIHRSALQNFPVPDDTKAPDA